jgi:hypothetical protein
MKNIVIPLSSVQILALSTAHVLLAPAPGQGYLWITTQSVFSFTPGSTPYAGGSNLNLYYGITTPSYGKVLAHKATINSATPALCCHATDLADISDVNPATLDNQPVICKLVGSPFTAGNGTAIVSLTLERVKLF